MDPKLHRAVLVRAAIVLAVLFTGMWLVCPFRKGLAFRIDWDAPLSGWEILRLFGLGALLVWVLFLVLFTADAIARGHTYSDETLKLADLVPKDEPSCGFTFALMVFGGGFYAMSRDWPWWTGPPLAAPLALAVYALLRLIGGFVWMVERFVVTGSFRTRPSARRRR